MWAKVAKEVVCSIKRDKVKECKHLQPLTALLGPLLDEEGEVKDVAPPLNDDGKVHVT